MAKLDDLVAALDSEDPSSTTTSLRIAVELGMAPTGNEATNRSMRASLEVFALQRALHEHFQAHPDARPALHEVAAALAVMDRSPLASRGDLLQQAEREVLEHRPDAGGDDVLLWATSLLRHEPAEALA